MYKYTYKFLTVRLVLCKLFVSEYRGFWELLAVPGRCGALCSGTHTHNAVPLGGWKLKASPLRVISKMSKVQKQLWLVKAQLA